MPKPHYILERCCDHLGNTFPNKGMHTNLDSTLSLDVIEKFQNYSINALKTANEFYKDSFDKLQASFSNSLMIISIIVGVFFTMVAIKLFWDIYISKKYIDNSVHLAEKNIQRSSVISYILAGNQIYKNLGNVCNREVFFQYYLALNYLLTIPLDVDNQDLYDCVLSGINTSWRADDISNEPLAIIPLQELKYGIEYSPLRNKFLDIYNRADQIIQAINNPEEIDNGSDEQFHEETE